MEFFDTTLGTPGLHIDTAIPPLMLTPITYGNGNQASPTSIAIFTLQSQGFRTKVTCPVLDLANELDVLLSHEWCFDHQVIISYKDEHVTFVHKDRPWLLRFDDPTHRQIHHLLLSVLSTRSRVLDRNNNALPWSWFSG